MKVIAVNGITKSGKTTVCEALISALTARGYSVGSVKEIHFEQFKIDPDQSTNTNRHKAAGSQLVTARGMYETDILYQSMLPIEQILAHYEQDFVILEGVSDCNCPRIITAHNQAEVEERIDCRAVAVAGVISNSGAKEICGLPVFNPLTEAEALADFAEKVAFTPLPDFDPDCCSKCGYTCRELTGRIIAGQAKRRDCVLIEQETELYINGKYIQMVPFVQDVLGKAIRAIAGTLDGYLDNSEVVVKIKK